MSMLLDINDDHIYTYRYGRYFSNGVLVMAVASIIGGILLIIQNLLIDYSLMISGLFLIVIGFSCFIPTELFQVNTHSKEFRVCVKFFSHYKGEWKTLNKVQYLSIIKRNVSVSRSRPSLMGAQVQHTAIQCNLRFYIKAGYYIEIDDFRNLEQASDIGRYFAKGLDLKLLNATERPPVFLDL